MELVGVEETSLISSMGTVVSTTDDGTNRATATEWNEQVLILVHQLLETSDQSSANARANGFILVIQKYGTKLSGLAF